MANPFYIRVQVVFIRANKIFIFNFNIQRNLSLMNPNILIIFHTNGILYFPTTQLLYISNQKQCHSVLEFDVFYKFIADGLFCIVLHKMNNQYLIKNGYSKELNMRQTYIIIDYIMTAQEEDQLTFKYLFTITPIEIISNSKLKNNNNKSILIKLGNKTAKCNKLNTPLNLQIDVLYSKTLQKYCPIKGIIKIYDISEDGSQIISCVGGFQTQQLLNEGKYKVTIEKQIGTSKLKMDIIIINLSGIKIDKEQQLKIEKQRSNSKDKYQQLRKTIYEKNSLAGITSSKFSNNSSLNSSNISQKNLMKPSSNSEYFPNRAKDQSYKSASSNINKSIQKINQALIYKRTENRNDESSNIGKHENRVEIQNMKCQLNEQKRKNAILEDKISKNLQKNSTLRSKILFYQQQIKSFYQSFKKISDNIDYLPKNRLNLEIDIHKKILSLKFKDKDIEKYFREFMDFMLIKLNQTHLVIEGQQINDHDANIELEQQKREINILKKLAFQKDRRLFQLQQQIKAAQSMISNLKESNKHLTEQNLYLRQKNDQVELSIFNKENAIQSLKKKLDKNNYDLQDLEGKLYNSGLEIEQLKQQISNNAEIIEKYRQKYGDLKNVKNRAIELQIKQCLRWIDQQNRDLQMSQMQETMQTQDKNEKDDSLSSVIRNIEIQKVPIEQMSIIRNQLLKILQKVDSLMNK